MDFTLLSIAASCLISGSRKMIVRFKHLDAFIYNDEPFEQNPSWTSAKVVRDTVFIDVRRTDYLD